MNGKIGRFRGGGKKRVMNYSSKLEDRRAGCQLSNRAERVWKEEGGNQAEA